MLRWLQGIILLGCVCFASASFGFSHFDEEVRCTNNDCLSSGYEKFDQYGDLIEIGICNNNDCDQYGWQVLRLNGINTDVVCINSSCYGDGYNEILVADNSLVSVRTCNNGDCLLYGWIDHIFQPAESLEGISCNENGCDSGFIIEEFQETVSGMEDEIAKIQSKIDHFESLENKFNQKKQNNGISQAIANFQIKLSQLQAELDELKSRIVIDSHVAECLAPDACFTVGYQVQ